MALIAHTKTKAELKAKVGEPAQMWLEETSLFGAEMVPGGSVVATNHPKRSWFAKVTLDSDGKIAKVE